MTPRQARTSELGTKCAAQDMGREVQMLVDDVIVKRDEPVRALIVHSLEEEWGVDELLKDIELLRSKGVDLRQVAIETYADLITVLETEDGAFQFFMLIAHGDRLTNAAWLVNDKDHAGNELSLSAPELCTLKPYLVDRVCIFAVCHIGTTVLADSVVSHDGALYALASKPDNTLTDYDIMEACVSLLNAVQDCKPSSVNLPMLRSVCVPRISERVRERMVDFYPGKDNEASGDGVG